MRMATNKMEDDYKCQQGCGRTASLHYRQTSTKRMQENLQAIQKHKDRQMITQREKL